VKEKAYIASKRLNCFYASLFVLAFLSFPVNAEIRIAVLNFELKDVTSNPYIPQEIERTASIKPLLQSALEKDSNHAIVQVDVTAQTNANGGFGYLFNYHDEAAKLGKKFGAQYVIVGRLHKPSFLFAYLMAHLVDVKTKKLIGNYVVEVKGPQKKITAKGVETLAQKIKKTIDP